MIRKIIFISFITIIFSEEIAIKHLIWGAEKKVMENSALLCIKLDDGIKKDDNFYLLFLAEEKNEKINKTIYYNLSEVSCENMNSTEINFNNLSNTFQYRTEKLYLCVDENKFIHEYEIKKENDNQKYMLTLYSNFSNTSGKGIKAKFSNDSASNIIILFIIIASIFLCIMLIITLIIYRYVNKKKREQINENFENSLKAPINNSSNK